MSGEARFFVVTNWRTPGEVVDFREAWQVPEDQVTAAEEGMEAFRQDGSWGCYEFPRVLGSNEEVALVDRDGMAGMMSGLALGCVEHRRDGRDVLTGRRREPGDPLHMLVPVEEFRRRRKAGVLEEMLDGEAVMGYDDGRMAETGENHYRDSSGAYWAAFTVQGRVEASFGGCVLLGKRTRRPVLRFDYTGDDDGGPEAEQAAKEAGLVARAVDAVFAEGAVPAETRTKALDVVGALAGLLCGRGAGVFYSNRKQVDFALPDIKVIVRRRTEEPS